MPNPDLRLARLWLEPRPVRVPEALQAAVGGHPLVAETLVRRGINDAAAARAFLDPAYYRPAPPESLPDLAQAVERVERAIRAGERICVWGDFDVDGQTATALLFSTLRDLGARVSYHIPDRQTESHGIHLPALQQSIAEGVTLVLTCDTGVTAHEAVDYARSRSVDVVITDHHDLPPDLPQACAVVNPKRLPEGDPLRELPGVGCAYKLAEALYARAGLPEAAERHLDLVALGIVADVAMQVGDTRYLLQRGMAALRRTERPGLQEMMALSELNPEWITEEHIGFVLAPRLNALGRLSNASAAVEFLTTTDRLRARILAAEMEGLNSQRKLLCEQVEQAALAQIEREPSLLEHAVLVLANSAWPGGVLGIVAGRLAERFNRPAILLMTPPGELARGSARSVEGCNITAAIAAHQEMLHSFGGHPMAAGLVMDAENIPAFRLALSRTVASMRGEAGEVAPLVIDGYLPLSALTLDLVAELERLAPFGLGNPPLTLATRGLTLTGQRPVGRDGAHLLLYVSDEEGTAQKVIRWQGADLALPEGRFDLAYAVRASNYRGQREVQVEWIDFRPLEEPAATLQPRAPALKIVDHRQALNPRGLLERLRAQHEVQVWAEAGHRAEMAGRDRTELEPGAALAIWTTPPSPSVLRAALERVSPRTVYLFGIDPGLDDAERFLARLAGLVKHVLHAQDGRTHLDVLAAATAQRTATVRVGLAWLAARGHCTVLRQQNGEVLLGPGGEPGDAEIEPITARLQALLAETAAYRAAFVRAESERLLE